MPPKPTKAAPHVVVFIERSQDRSDGDDEKEWAAHDRVLVAFAPVSAKVQVSPSNSPRSKLDGWPDPRPVGGGFRADLPVGGRWISRVCHSSIIVRMYNMISRIFVECARFRLLPTHVSTLNASR